VGASLPGFSGRRAGPLSTITMYNKFPITRCRNCLQENRCPARGLCQGCYLDPKIRGQYPARMAKAPSGGVVRGSSCGEALRQPTRHRPGTEGKLAVLAARFAAGLPLFHSEDPRLEE
jgi:hypothetical protein